MRLVHLSDLHLGFRAYHQVERGWNQRERDLAAAFRWALQEAARLKPDMLLITGDVFDRPDPPSTAFLTFHRGVAHLRNQLPLIPILIIAGERDSPPNLADPGPVGVLDALRGVEAAAGAPRAIRFRGSRLHALLLPYRAVAHPPFPEVRPDPDADWNVLLIRGTPSQKGGGIFVDPADWDYVAVGGTHHTKEWAPNVRGAGSLERTGFSPWGEAAEEKGFLSVELENGSTEFHSVPARPVVDLAPVRVSPSDDRSGTRRLRELLQGVPGGIQGKIVRIRLRGDVTSPTEGVSQGLIDAIRAEVAHLEMQVESGLARVDHADHAERWKPNRILAEGLPPVSVEASGRRPTVTLFTAASEADRSWLADALRERDGTGSSLGNGKLRITPPTPHSPILHALWAGGSDPILLIRTVLGALKENGGDVTPLVTHDGEGAAQGSELRAFADLAEMEQDLTKRRADWVEASGDLEVATLQWAQNRQDADSKLQAYRARAAEIRARIKSLAAEGPASDCPTCGQRLGDESAKLLKTLRSEWENVVQDGRWWKRRRQQLDEKPEELQRLEETALRHQVEVEAAAEALERRKERERGLEAVRLQGSQQSGHPAPSQTPELDPRDPLTREIVRLTGSLLSRITEGRIAGLQNEGGRLHVVGVDGRARPPAGIERAGLRLAAHLALWLFLPSEAKGAGSLLLWELHESSSEKLLPGAMELLFQTDSLQVPVLLVAPPAALELAPEAFDQVVELVVDPRGRPGFRHELIPRGEFTLGSV